MHDSMTMVIFLMGIFTVACCIYFIFDIMYLSRQNDMLRRRLKKLEDDFKKMPKSGVEIVGYEK